MINSYHKFAPLGAAEVKKVDARKRFVKIAAVTVVLFLLASFLFACAYFDNGKTSVNPSLLKEEASLESKDKTQSEEVPSSANDDVSGQDVPAQTTLSGDTDDNGENADNSGENEDGGAPSSGQTANDDQTQGEQTGDGQNDGDQSTDGSGNTPLCSVCGNAMSEDSAHKSTCSHYAVLPEDSEAYGFLSALPGVKEDLVATSLDEENEIYSFALNYLSEQGAERVKLELLRCTVKFSERNADGSVDLHVQKIIGDKAFTFTVKVTSQSGVYKATFSVRGYALQA